MKSITIYTDGACRGNPGPGGWGALLKYGEITKKISGAERHTTNNRMELTAAIQAIATIKQRCVIDLHTDSQYLRKGMTEWIDKWKKQGWKTAQKTPVKNIDLWQALDEQVATHQIRWHWVKGHSNHPDNDLADALANQAIDHLLEREACPSVK